MSYQTFSSQWLGKRIDFDLVEGYQCVDLVKQYISQEFGIRPGSWGNAIKYWTNTAAILYTKFDRIQTTSVKQGDIVILKTVGYTDYGGAGHIGIASGLTTPTTAQILEQNGSTGGGTGTGADAIRTRYIPLYRIAGVLRPKVVAPSPTPQPHPYQWAVGKTVYLKPVPSWRVYKRGTNTVAGVLVPANFGGLYYLIRGVDPVYKTRVYIHSAAFGDVSLPIDADAVIL